MILMTPYWKFTLLTFCLLLNSHSAPVQAADTSDAFRGLLQVLKETDDTQLQLDILRGMSEALKGRRQIAMPAGWPEIEAKFERSSQREVKTLAQSLSLTFGSTRAQEALRNLSLDRSADLAMRRTALESLLNARDPGLPGTSLQLLSDPALRGQALRALAAYDDPQTPSAILSIYSSLNGPEKRDALNTLVARVAYAKTLLAAVETGRIPVKDLTADIIRQLRNLRDSDIEATLQKVWGVVRDSSADKRQEIARYRAIYAAGGSTPGDSVRGRAVYARVCQQCHTLFDTGGKTGPDLTGANRNDIEYLLQNILDPNAVIPNEYRTSTIETRDERVITGIIQKQDDRTAAIATATEIIVLPRSEIKSVQNSEISMMPEGLLANLTDQEVRDLIYYLTRQAQVALLANSDTIGFFFSGKDLTNWDGNPDLWKVENGEIVGRTATGLQQNEFLKSQMVFSDFRLVCQVKLTPNAANSGIQFRSELLADGEVKGYQADMGAGWWGKLYEEKARGLLWDKSGDAYVKPGEWNQYEIVAVGHRILTAINGKPCVEISDEQGATQGIIALQLHSGGPMEVRFKDFQLELNPAPELKTVR